MDIRRAKVLLHALGSVVCVLFIAQNVWLIIEFHELVTGPWSFFNWFGNVLLYLSVGCFGVYMEVYGKSRQTFCSSAIAHLGLALFYFWLGCYSLGSPRPDAWKKRAYMRVLAILAWVAAVGNLLSAFIQTRAPASASAEQARPQPQAQPQQQPVSKKKQQVGRDQSQAPGQPRQQSEQPVVEEASESQGVDLRNTATTEGEGAAESAETLPRLLGNERGTGSNNPFAAESSQKPQRVYGNTVEP
eukprot:TRINITY_DN17809_c0_g1_i1.p1 TRINITY_DN17809_c0_g1~~TRINITY_DN17809_c0_g1_i1.p1  ORF type:complete len:245 (+),score=24.85 TRINITY_DN17809_c0_g1_i1:55-789(+)